MDAGAAGGVGLVLADDLADHGRGVAAAEQQVAHQVRQRVALGPLEVRVRPDARGVAQGEQDRGDGVGRGRAVGAQDAVPADFDARAPSRTSLNRTGR